MCSSDLDIFNRAKNLAPYFQEGLMSLKDIDVVDNIRGYGTGGLRLSWQDLMWKNREMFSGSLPILRKSLIKMTLAICQILILTRTKKVISLDFTR